MVAGLVRRMSVRMVTRGGLVVVVAVVVAAVLALLLVIHPGAAPLGATGSGRRPVLVAAASSLSVVAPDLESGFEAAHPDLDLVFNFAGSSSLREQVLDGLPADVLVTANTEVMDEVEQADLVVGSVAVVTTNRIVAAVPDIGGGGVDGASDEDPTVDDLASAGVTLGVCVATVPCGRAGDEFLDRLGIVVAPATREPDVRALVTKLEAGELDLGLVYVSDVAASGGGLRALRWPDAPRVEARYPAAVLVNGDNPLGGTALVDYLASDSAQILFRLRGFGEPALNQPALNQPAFDQPAHDQPKLDAPREGRP